MERDPITVLLQLGAVALVAIGAMLLLWRLGERRSVRDGIVHGYPPSMFPNQELARCKPLAALAAIQARLLVVYEQAPPQSDLVVWLRPFLAELRAIMDTAYRVAAISSPYGGHAVLERLVADVQAIEAQVAEHAIKLMLAAEGDAQHEPLDGRLATLQLCARELEAAAGPAASVLAR